MSSTSTKPPLHFSHANSFPAGSYRKLLAHFEADFDVGYIDMLGHNPSYPVSDCWPALIDESLAYIESRYREPVIALGHSLGGFLSFLCAIRRPELFRQVILLDSPIFSRRVSTLLWLSKQIGLIERITPGKGTLRRRRHWPSAAAAYQHFQGRGMFASFDPDCLGDYIAAGTAASPDGVVLKFEPRVEHAIYCGLPHHLPSLRGQLKVPTTFIGGRQSDYVRRADLRHMQRHFGITLEQIDGGHLFPFERPAQTAKLIREIIKR